MSRKGQISDLANCGQIGRVNTALNDLAVVRPMGRAPCSFDRVRECGGPICVAYVSTTCRFRAAGCDFARRFDLPGEVVRHRWVVSAAA